MKKKKQFPLALWIFVGLCVGIIAGLILMVVPNGVEFGETYIKPFGTIFLNLLKFVVVPIVLFSIAAGVISMVQQSPVPVDCRWAWAEKRRCCCPAASTAPLPVI